MIQNDRLASEHNSSARRAASPASDEPPETVERVERDSMAHSTIDAAPPGMKWIDGGEFAIGSDVFYAEERPVHRVAVDGFWMDEHAVTAAEFRRFVRETGYVTVAERPLDPDDYPDADPELLVPGSRGVPKEPWAGRAWTTSETGGRTSRSVLEAPGRPRHDDQRPRSTTPSSRSPTRTRRRSRPGPARRFRSEAQWEYAARGGFDGAVFAWGDAELPEGRPMANTWQGEFPWQNLKLDGYEGTSPVGSYPPTATASST